MIYGFWNCKTQYAMTDFKAICKYQGEGWKLPRFFKLKKKNEFDNSYSFAVGSCWKNLHVKSTDPHKGF